jgi:hypothetical protein
MSLFVVDASVGIKWFVPEILSAGFYGSSGCTAPALRRY